MLQTNPPVALLLIGKVPFLFYNVQLPIKEKKEAVEQCFLFQVL
jgi:hypothetical protein